MTMGDIRATFKAALPRQYELMASLKAVVLSSM